MAESQNGYDLAEYENELDSIIAGVMPDSWHGHARLKIAERDFSDKQAEAAKRLSARMLEKYENADAKTIAEKCIEKAEEKFD